MYAAREAKGRQIGAAWIATSIAAALLLVSCNGDPLDTSGTSNNNSQTPVITSSPTNATVTAGQSATFMVIATGAPTITYQWFRGTDAIPGAMSSTYTLATTTVNDNGAVFSVEVSNPFGSVSSSSATLTVR